MKVLNHLDLEKELGDINNDRCGIYDKKIISLILLC